MDLVVAAVAVVAAAVMMAVMTAVMMAVVLGATEAKVVVTEAEMAEVWLVVTHRV